MKIQNIILSLTAVALTAWLVGCKQKTNPAEDAAKDIAYAETTVNPAPDTVATTVETAKAATTDVAESVKDAAAPTTSGTVRYNAQPSGSKATVSGDSSIKDWSMDSGVIGGSMEVDAGFPESALTNAAAARPETTVYVPVRSLKSGKTAMDERMQLTMSMTDFPKIEYRVIELKPKSKPGSTGPLEFDAVGALTIVGKTITNTMPVTIEKKDGKLKIAGSTPLKLTQFEIPPPVIALPLLPDIKVYDDLKVDFEWTLAPKAEKK